MSGITKLFVGGKNTSPRILGTSPFRYMMAIVFKYYLSLLIIYGNSNKPHKVSASISIITVVHPILECLCVPDSGPYRSYSPPYVLHVRCGPPMLIQSRANGCARCWQKETPAHLNGESCGAGLY